MEPDYTSPCGTVTMYRGDCLAVLPTLEAGSVDAVVTDPPFNAGKGFANDNLDGDEWRGFCGGVSSAIHRLSPANVLVEVGKNERVMGAELERHFQYRYALCLNYTNSMRNGAVGYSNWGMVLWFSRGGKCHQRYKDRLDCALHNTKTEFEHPSPKEIGHYRKLVEMFTLSEHAILDPFMGSGTTAVACIQTGRRFIGVELEPKYFDIAVARVEKALADKAERFVYPEAACSTQ